ncbi:3-isopropylmalate dehydratase small subunit [Acetonema longum]|uniref:3-isopropylmalate dehydratase small subunit n=1 Tax=Acetonema longum DSM 6540 TaxID=1009370 RepID=F7NJF0_9FIRM|nr:3-isopropylmalate dehydratase small subunit [Acetonema longum]EGO63898.1 3-isopropylmalate dehydratase small subunit [Acetonema longum DSM 6540]
MILQGKIWIYGDNVDTDAIIPARYLNTADPKELAKHCMEDIDTTFAGKVKPGEMIVAGRNFGCGSSREHAPVAIKASGIACVVADSFARIFYRNAINIGLPLLELGPAVHEIAADDTLAADLAKGTVTSLSSGKVFQAQPLPSFVQEIAAAGGLIEYLKGVKA